MNELYIIILNWNGFEDTKQCLISLRNENNLNYTIILVDNHSEEDEYVRLEHYCKQNYSLCLCYDEKLAKKGGNKDDEELLSQVACQDRIILIRNSDNLGFAAGNNVALDYVLKRGKKYALLLNNDTEILQGSIERLFNFKLQNPKIAAVVPQIRLYEPPNQIWNCGGRITWYGARFYYYPNADISLVPQEGYKFIDYATGCALLFDVTQTGKLTERFFFGEEDFEFALRLKKMHLKAACFFPSIIYHKVGSSQKKGVNSYLGHVCLHYSMRLSDLRAYQNVIIWIISCIIYFISSFFMMKKHYSISIYAFVKIWECIVSNIISKKIFDKETYLSTIKINFYD